MHAHTIPTPPPNTQMHLPRHRHAPIHKKETHPQTDRQTDEHTEEHTDTTMNIQTQSALLADLTCDVWLQASGEDLVNDAVAVIGVVGLLPIVIPLVVNQCSTWMHADTKCSYKNRTLQKSPSLSVSQHRRDGWGSISYSSKNYFVFSSTLPGIKETWSDLTPLSIFTDYFVSHVFWVYETQREVSLFPTFFALS